MREIENDPSVMIFDPSAGLGGHHAEYIEHILRYWAEWNGQGYFTVVTSPYFVAGFVEELPNNYRDRVKLMPLTELEISELRAQGSVFKQALFEWRLFKQYAQQTRCSHGISMYIDRLLLPLAFGLHAPCTISGIYFRPSFHYKYFEAYQPSRKDSLQALRQQWILRGALRNHTLTTLFSLDPLATKYIRQLSDKTDVITLVDPVKIPMTPENQAKLTNDFRQKLHISPDRRIFLLFGVLTARKGINQVLDAICLLDQAVTQKICLLLVGRIELDMVQIQEKLQQVRELTGAQIILDNQFVSEENIQNYFCLTDVVLATYQRHVGMSGIVLRAAAAGKPLLSTDYGLMGELVRKYQLGLVVNCEDARTISWGLLQFLTVEKTATMINKKSANQLALEHEIKHFVFTLLSKTNILYRASNS